MYNIYVDGKKYDFEHNVEKAIAIAKKAQVNDKLKVVIKNENGQIVWPKKIPQ